MGVFLPWHFKVAYYLKNKIKATNQHTIHLAYILLQELVWCGT